MDEAVEKVYRLLEDDESIVAGDQFKPALLSDSLWSPADGFEGWTVARLSSSNGRLLFRRLVSIHDTEV